MDVLIYIVIGYILFIEIHTRCLGVTFIGLIGAGHEEYGREVER